MEHVHMRRRQSHCEDKSNVKDCELGLKGEKKNEVRSTDFLRTVWALLCFEKVLRLPV